MPFLLDDTQGRGWILVDPRRDEQLHGLTCDPPDLARAHLLGDHAPPVDGLRPQYELAIRDGDIITLRAKFIAMELGTYTPGLAAFKLIDGELEPGRASEVASRRGYHWYREWETSVVFGSMAAVVVVALAGAVVL